MKWRGVLIVESLLENDYGIWDRVNVRGESKKRLEEEEFRGEFTFCNIEVSDEEVDRLMHDVAISLRPHGWYFHVEKDGVVKVAYPGKVMEISHDNPDSTRAATEYGMSIGIHPEQLWFERLMGIPFDT